MGKLLDLLDRLKNAGYEPMPEEESVEVQEGSPAAPRRALRLVAMGCVLVVLAAAAYVVTESVTTKPTGGLASSQPQSAQEYSGELPPVVDQAAEDLNQDIPAASEQITEHSYPGQDGDSMRMFLHKPTSENGRVTVYRLGHKPENNEFYAVAGQIWMEGTTIREGKTIFKIGIKNTSDEQLNLHTGNFKLMIRERWETEGCYSFAESPRNFTGTEGYCEVVGADAYGPGFSIYAAIPLAPGAETWLELIEDNPYPGVPRLDFAVLFVGEVVYIDGQRQLHYALLDQ